MTQQNRETLLALADDLENKAIDEASQASVSFWVGRSQDEPGFRRVANAADCFIVANALRRAARQLRATASSLDEVVK